jgi:hypothetical protein
MIVGYRLRLQIRKVTNMLRVESEKRLEIEDRLSGFQRKKGAIIYGSAPKDLRTGTPVAYKVISGIEEREVDDFIETINEVGEIERVKTKKVIKLEQNSWAFGVISGMQPAVDERGLHGNGYEITISDGSTVTVPRDAIITAEMHDQIKYKPTLLMLYRHDEPVMVVLYTWDSMYLPCTQLSEFVPGLLDDSFMRFIDSQHGYEVVDHRLTVSVTDANKNVHSFGPMECTLFQNSDCRGCLSRLLNWSDSGWNNTRNLAKQLCGRGTMYADGNFVIRRGVNRELFIRFIEVEKWANIRGGKYLLHLVEAILQFQEEHKVGLPEHQLVDLTEIIKAKVKDEYVEIKDSEDKAALDAYKLIKKQLNASLKKIESYDEEMEVEGEEEVAVDE